MEGDKGPIQDPTDTKLQIPPGLQGHATQLCASRNTQGSLGISSFGLKDISRDKDDIDLGGTRTPKLFLTCLPGDSHGHCALLVQDGLS